MFSTALYDSFVIPDQLKIIQGDGGFPFINIDNEHAGAVVSIYGAQVLSYKKKTNNTEASDLFFVSEKAYFEEGKAIKGGIPICWPWFGDDQEKVGKKIHGFVRTMLWQLDETTTLEGGETHVVLSVGETPETLKLWPHNFNLKLAIIVGKTLKLSLQTINTSESSFVITQALHPYFAIDQIDQTKVLGLDKASYIDKVAGETTLQLQSNDVTFNQELDRIYIDVPSELVLLDESSERKVKIKSKGSKTAIVWNPWIEISQKSGDLIDTAYQHFVCVETANAVDDKVIIESNQSHTMEAEYLT